MESWHEILEFLRGQPVIVRFMLLGVGYLLGRVHIAGIQPGPIAGTLLISLVLGHYGFRISAGWLWRKVAGSCSRLKLIGVDAAIEAAPYRSRPREATWSCMTRDCYMLPTRNQCYACRFIMPSDLETDGRSR